MLNFILEIISLKNNSLFSLQIMDKRQLCFVQELKRTFKQSAKANNYIEKANFEGR